jgi:hypothetical protein
VRTQQELEQDGDMLRRALVVAYTVIDSSDETGGVVFSALSLIRYCLDETGGFQRAMHPEPITEHNEVWTQ